MYFHKLAFLPLVYISLLSLVFLRTGVRWCGLCWLNRGQIIFKVLNVKHRRLKALNVLYVSIRVNVVPYLVLLGEAETELPTYSILNLQATLDRHYGGSGDGDNVSLSERGARIQGFGMATRA